MPNLLQRGAAFLDSKLKTAAGRTIVYHRGQLSSAAITAVNNHHEETIVDAEGFATKVNIESWIVTTTDLVIRGEQIKPERRDWITETLNGEEIEYEVLPISAMRPEYEKTDSSNLMTTIHTKRVK